MTSTLLHAFGILLFAFSWLAYDHYRPWVNFHSETLALAGVGLLLASQFVGRRFPFVQAPRTAFWIFALALVPWLQYLLGISLFAGDALVTSLFLFGLGAAITLGYSYLVAPVEPEKALIPIFYALWVVALVSAAIGLLQWLDLTEKFTVYVLQSNTGNGNRAMGNLGQPNQLATLLLMGMACLTWSFERRRLGHLGLFFGIAFMTLALVLTQSRAGMVSALVVAIFLMRKNRNAASRLPAWSIFCWLLTFFLMVLALPAINEFMLMSNERGGIRFSDGARVTMWKQMLSGIAQSPWVGYGWNQTATAHAAGSTVFPGSLTFTYGHNIVLDIVAWNGVPLGALITGVCIWWFASRVKRVKNTDAIYAMACLLPVAVHSMVEFPFAYSYFLLASGVMVGIVERFNSSTKTVKFKVRWMGMILAIWLVLGTYMVYEYFLIEEDFRVVRFENLRLGQTPDNYEVPKIWMLSHMAAMLSAGRQQALPGMSKAELENLRKASLRFPYGALALRNALALGLNGDPSGATHQMAVIRGMFGAAYYNAAVGVLREQQLKYPELALVITAE